MYVCVRWLHIFPDAIIVFCNLVLCLVVFCVCVRAGSNNNEEMKYVKCGKESNKKNLSRILD